MASYNYDVYIHELGPWLEQIFFREAEKVDIQTRVTDHSWETRFCTPSIPFGPLLSALS